MPEPVYGLQSILPTPPKALGSVFGEQEHPEEDFIKLMVAQLQNQDPEKPMDGTALISQMMQMNAAIATNRMAWQTSENHLVSTAASLLGHDVIVQDPKTGQSAKGKVTTVDYNDARPMVVVGGKAYPVESVSRLDG